MRGNFNRSFLGRLNNKVFYISALALVAVVATGFLLSLDSSNTVSAQRGDLISRNGSKSKVARADQLAFALNFGSASEYTVFGEKGIKGDGSGVKGRSGSSADEASLGEDGSGVRARSGVTKAISMINQLPCQDMDDAITGGTFKPGVYCAPSAELAGQMVLDADGDATGSFVFRIAGSMKTTADFQMNLENGAKAGNVFFVADTASLAPWTSVIGSVIARGTVGVGDGASIKGRAFSKEGEVILGDASNVALADAYIQICKRALHDGIATTAASGFDPLTLSSDLSDDQNSLRYKIFQFQINGGAIVEVPTGSCSNPILVVDGNNTIQELLNGFYTNRPDRTVASGNWFNRFRLVNVSQAGYLPSSGAPSGTGITSTDYTTRRVNVNVAPSPSTNPLILTFTNTFAIPAVIEICKYPSQETATGESREDANDSVPVNDNSVSGFFDFTVNTNVGITYTIPVGVCTGPIQVLAATIPQVALPGSPAPGTTADASVYVTELAEPGFTLESMTTSPSGRQQGEVFNRAFPNSQLCAFYHEFYNPLPGCLDTPNAGGGYQWGQVYEASTPQDQTIFNFFNRSNPGIIKVCKIAGRGVPIGTRFRFEVRGREAGPAVGPILPGQNVVRNLVVAAGPADQGGFCSIVTDPAGNLPEGGPATRFIVGTQAFVQEIAVLDDVPGVQAGGFGDTNASGPQATTPPSEVRVSRIRVNGVGGSFPTGIVQGRTLGNQGAAGNAGNTNPNLWSDQSATAIVNRGAVIFTVNRGETVVDYVNRLFRPTRLKLCKVAASPTLVGRNFTFGITIDNENGLVPGQTNEPITIADVTIPAGDPGPSGQGNCVIVSGPYESMDPNDIPVKGTFDVGSTITVTEGAVIGTQIVSITSPTGTPIVDLGNRRASLTLVNPGGFNELVFTNRDTPPTDPSLQPRALSARTDDVCAGNITQVSIDLLSLGDEVSANFVVQFDQTKLANPVVSLGADALALGFTLAVDYSNVANGQIGISLTNPTGPFPAGLRELVVIDFFAQLLSSGDALVSFGGPTQTLTNTLNDVLESVPGEGNVSIGGPECFTSTSVTVTGRVMSQEGTGLRNASVIITDQQGNRRSVTTSSLGYYQIDDVKAGDTYVIAASAKRYRFEAKLIQVSDGLSNVDFVGME